MEHGLPQIIHELWVMGYVKASNIAICAFCAIEQQHRISQRGKWACDGE